MTITKLDHVQLAMPPGREAEARAFYQGLLGFREVPKPPQLAARGGCWFQSGDVKVHLGVDHNFVPAKKAHPAFVVRDLRKMVDEFEKAGVSVTSDMPLDGYVRNFVHDPFGNRIELMQSI